ncbi:MAG: DUF4185 domain-containing protein [Acidobacteriota bacterium]|nr:DUF4185 domain-containing protein [Acidobacteriota bacterium]
MPRSLEHPALPLRRALLLPALCLLLLPARGLSAGASSTRSVDALTLPLAPSPSQFFAAGTEEPYSTYQMPGDGDLWPTCWADDDNLYTANGDGSAFTGAPIQPAVLRPDLQVSRISGTPPHLTGTALAANVGTNWSGPGFNRKPTGMLCRRGTLYLAFQNLDSKGFNTAPAASIARSTDHGITWQWESAAPMFGGPGQPSLFTTIFFLDFGRDAGNAIDRFVYAYGLDYNWRGQQTLYLARVPASRVLDRHAWQFYAGPKPNGKPYWDAQIEHKVPVLLDTRIVRPQTPGTICPATDSVIAQGGVVYDKPLKRFLYTSWSCSTHEFYEAPKPWGPWRHVLSHDFGPQWSARNRGQYGTTVPSKFISADGTRFLLQSNVCCSGDSYTFSLREVRLDLAHPDSPGPQEQSPQDQHPRAALATSSTIPASRKP